METSKALSARSLQYYVIARQWASDLEFFTIETAFFNRLLNDYFVRLSDAAHVLKLRETGKALLKLEEDKTKASRLLDDQLKELELMAEDIIPEDTEQLAGKQIELENMLHDITLEFRSVKQQLFALVEQAMDRKLIVS